VSSPFSVDGYTVLLAETNKFKASLDQLIFLLKIFNVSYMKLIVRAVEPFKVRYSKLFYGVRIGSAS
jgi:hypothetical protein